MSNLSSALQLKPASSQLPVYTYFDEALLAREREVLFKHGPRYVGHELMVPEAGDDAWKVRMWDRFFDGYVAEQLQKVVGDNLRPGVGVGGQHRGGIAEQICRGLVAGDQQKSAEAEDVVVGELLPVDLGLHKSGD